jgi:signal transduction histidine kinase
MQTPTLLQSVMMLTNLLTVSMSGSLIFSTLARPKRTLAHLLFALFGMALGGWAVTSFLLMQRSLDLTILSTPAPFGLDALAAAFMIIWVLAFYGFVFLFFRTSSLLPRIASLLALPVGIISLGLIAAWALSPDLGLLQPELPQWRTLIFIYGILVVYLALAFWLLFSSNNPVALLWVLPAFLLVLAGAINLLQIDALSYVDSLLVMVAAIVMAWSVMWYQPFNQLSELNAELRTANRDLQQAVSELAQEKSRTEALNAELRASNDYKTGFLSNLSHELRTPLNSIIGYSELLINNLYGTLNEKQTDRLEKIHRNGTHLLEVIGHILELNRLEAGKLQLHIAAFDLRDVLLRLRTQLEEQVHAAHLELTLTLVDEPLTVTGDPERVQQIVQNLIRNAILLTEKGSITLKAAPITVSRGVSTSSDGFELPAIGWLRDGAWVILTVTDTGRGIALEDQARIFDEFAQVEGAYPEEYGSSGLLLALTQRLVVLHDGAIWVKSTVGVGSSFYVALPAEAQNAKRRTYETPHREAARL